MKWIFSTVIIFFFLSYTQLVAQNKDAALDAYEMRMNGRPFAALDLLDSSLVVYPDSSRIWFEKGRCLDWIKTDGCNKFRDTWSTVSPRLRKSGKCFRVACRLDPENARYHYWMSQNLALRALVAFYSPWKWPTIRMKIKSSVRHAKIAVHYNPQDPQYRYDLVSFARFGWLLGGNKRLARAHADTLSKMNTVYGVMASELLATRKHPYDALTRLRELEKDYPADARLLRNLAMKYNARSAGDSVFADTARLYMIKLLNVDPKNSWAMNQYLRSLPKNRKTEALPYIDNFLIAVEADYGCYRSSALRIKSQYLKSTGDHEKAEQYLKEANHLNPNNNSTFISDWKKP